MGLSERVSQCWSLRHNLRYNTVQIVAIKNFKLSVLHMFLQICICLYVVVYVIVVKRGYQSFGPVTGSSALKVKGSAYNAGGLPWSANGTVAPDHYEQIFDSSDLVYPSQERDAIFVTTNLWVTPNQTRSLCYPGSEDWFNTQVDIDGNEQANCDAFCVRGTVVNEKETQTGGVWSGRGRLDNVSKLSVPGKLNCFCELYTWCPDENVPKHAPPNAFVLKGVETWTISVRQNVNFHSFDVVTTNSQPKSSTLPPIYVLQDLIAMSGGQWDNATRESGGILVFDSQWNCNLDFSLDHCNPVIDLVRLSSSFNFRRVEFDAGIFSGRQLIKQFGVRIVVILSGSAGKFDIAALLTNIGAGIGLLAVASLAADLIAVHLLGNRATYAKAKYKHLEVTEEGRARAITAGGGTATAGSLAAIEMPGVVVAVPGNPRAELVADCALPSDLDLIDPDEQEEDWARRKA